ncbi:MAG: phage tail protein [Negativicutes bacterium]|nr:phage tail protein [Negativicutes bacterium]
MSKTTVINNKLIPSDFLPIGFLGFIPFSSIPAGWLLRDGAIYNVADYPELFAKIGNAFGGDGVLTFALPDDRGLFVRGLDMAKGIDAGRVLGSYQEQDVMPHQHETDLQNVAAGIHWGGGSSGLGNMNYGTSMTSGSGDLTRSFGTTETRPKNRAYVPIIKAKNIYYDMTIQGGNAASLGGNPATYYAAASQVVKNTDFSGTFGPNGYQKLPSGLIFQWGGISLPTANSTTGTTFPIAFTTACYNVSATTGYSSYANQSAITVNSMSVTGFNIVNNSSIVPWAYWQAIGK